MAVNQPTYLHGAAVQLELFNTTHFEALYQAAQNQTIWTYNLNKAFGASFQPWFEKACKHLNEGTQLPFVVRDLQTNQIIGSTRFYHISHEHRHLAIGYTWYVPEAWGTLANPESKYLLLQYAFETLKFNRVEFVTDIRNARSQAAVKKLGAKQEGILRQHLILADGTARDSVVFSIIHTEWESVKANLAKRMSLPQ